jgi:hypothetical protein
MSYYSRKKKRYAFVRHWLSKALHTICSRFFKAIKSAVTDLYTHGLIVFIQRQYLFSYFQFQDKYGWGGQQNVKRLLPYRYECLLKNKRLL